MPSQSMYENPRRARGRCGAFVLVAITLGACGVSKKEVAEARSSVYDADFAVVYSAVVEATRSLYPNFDDDPAAGVVKTAWHQVKYSDPGADDPKSVQARDQTASTGAATPGQGKLGYTPSLANRVNFIRFDISVKGGRPWRVRVRGTAAELAPGNALPTELRGGDEPHWLAGRTDALVVAIHRKLKKYAKHLETPVAAEPVDDAPPIEISGDIAKGARDAAAAVVGALRKRDYDTLRSLVADDVTWSLGAAPGVDAAMAMWQADPGTFDEMAKAISAGCRRDGEEAVCPAAAEPGAWVVRLGQRTGVWKIVGFYIPE